MAGHTSTVMTLEALFNNIEEGRKMEKLRKVNNDFT